MKPMKMHTKGGKWYIENGNRTIELDSSKDAWQYIFYMLVIRAAIKVNSTIPASILHPVRSLVPHPVRGC